MCIPEGANIASVCPITAIAFSLDDMDEDEKSKYYRAKPFEHNQRALAEFYVSKTVAAHPIEEVRVKAAIPCWSRQEYSQPDKQQFYFTEVAGFQDQCRVSN